MKTSYAIVMLAVVAAAAFALVCDAGDSTADAAVGDSDEVIDFYAEAVLDPEKNREKLTIRILEPMHALIHVTVSLDGATIYSGVNMIFDSDRPINSLACEICPLDPEKIYTVTLDGRGLTEEEYTMHGSRTLDPYSFKSELWYDLERNDFEVNCDRLMAKGVGIDENIWTECSYEIRCYETENVYTGNYTVVQTGVENLYNRQQTQYLSIDETVEGPLSSGYYRIVMKDGDDLMAESRPTEFIKGAPAMNVKVLATEKCPVLMLDAKDNRIVYKETFEFKMPQYSMLFEDSNGRLKINMGMDCYYELTSLPSPGCVHNGWTLIEKYYSLDNEVIDHIGVSSDERPRLFRDCDIRPEMAYDVYSIDYVDTVPREEPLNPSEFTVYQEIHLENDYHNGYTFLGWTGNGITEPSLDVTIPLGTHEDLVFTAHWELTTYTLRYDGMEGAVDPGNPTTCTCKDSFYLKNPTKEGYTFIGWKISGIYDLPSRHQLVEGIICNTAYTAVWQELEYFTLTYTNMEGAVDPGNPTQVTQEDEFILKNPTMEGYLFTGWTNENLPEEKQVYRMQMKVSNVFNDREYRAHWFLIPEYWEPEMQDPKGDTGIDAGIPQVPTYQEPELPSEDASPVSGTVYIAAGTAAVFGILGLMYFLKRKF